MAKLVEIWRTQTRQKQRLTPIRTFALQEVRTGATAPHSQLQPVKLRGAPNGVCESVGCARQQSYPYAARNDSLFFFVKSKLRASSTQHSQKRKFISPAGACCSGSVRHHVVRKYVNTNDLYYSVFMETCSLYYRP